MRKVITLYDTDLKIVESVQELYQNSFAAAVRMIIRDWDRQRNATLLAAGLAKGQVTTAEYEERQRELQGQYPSLLAR